MATSSAVEDRLEAIEKTLAELQRKIEVQRPSAEWLNHVIGLFEDEPAFDDVIRLGREFRISD
jgi:hypothetical protein